MNQSSENTGVFNGANITTSQPRWSDFVELTKPRLSLMSVITAILGYFAAGPELNLGIFANLVLGTALAAFGCGVLNQWWERDADAKMDRTKDRPIASGRMPATIALIYGLSLSLVGVGLLWFGVNEMASILTFATILLYLLAYTPLKMKTVWATEMGAIPGAIPPLVGWVAAGAGFSTMGWVLFGILFAWQIPHFMAISWNCREDYRQGGFKMLSIVDPSGKRVGVKAFIWTIILIAVSLYPMTYPEFGWGFGLVSSLLGLYMLAPAFRFAFGKQKNFYARKLFIATLVYLPVYLCALVVDRFFLNF